MFRLTLLAAPVATLLVLVPLQNAQAQTPGYLGSAPAQFAGQAQAAPIYYVNSSPGQPQADMTNGYCPGNGGQYPVLNAPLYPSPQPNIPVQTGITAITNQALAPHEMLYPHKYRALYPPFFYRVKGGWMWTPVGMRSYDSWHLQGTQVDVKYRSQYKLFSGFRPPYVR